MTYNKHKETPFDELLTDISNLIREYNATCTSISRDKVQEYRDNLANLYYTLSHYAADFYEDSIGATITRKIEENRELDNQMETIKAKNRAEIKARINCEQYYRNEVQAESISKRAQFTRESVSQVLNSISSRLHSVEKG